jgi:hypothetical protein
MLKKKIHMQDQIPNRIEVIMGEGRLSMVRHLEEFSIAILMITVFLLGAAI